MAEQAARAFALELNRVGTDLADATHRLMCAFAELAAAEERADDGGVGNGDGGPCHGDSIAETSSDGVPDPMMLLRRLSRLEAALPGLREQSRDLAVRRPELVRETCEALRRNAHEIQTLSASMGISNELVDSGGSSEADEEWSEVVARVSDQQRKHTIRVNSSRAMDGAHPSTDMRLRDNIGDEDDQAAWASSVVAAGARRRQRGASTPALFSGRK